MNRIWVQRATRGGDIPLAPLLRAWAQAALRRVDVPGEVTIRIVNEREGAALNRDWRGRDYATNVLSFPLGDADSGPDAPLGDLVVCAPVVAREAAEQGKPVDAHWAHMVVHGALHLAGLDHERDDEAEAMEALEAEILAGLGFSDPYEPREVA
ncbi:MAG: rRNA maturation RNase YbeY [Chromatiales bacterium]|nr:rRNA maturation RNase YbeY [Chromatiales bacterium]